MAELLKSAGKNRDLVRTNDKINPFGLRIDGTVVTQSWKKVLVESLLGDDAFRVKAEAELDNA
jgi:hypothetical protein